MGVATRKRVPAAVSDILSVSYCIIGAFDGPAATSGVPVQRVPRLRPVPMIASEPLHHFIDDYLSYLYETNPSAATFDGVHIYDDLLENLDRAAVDAQVQALSGMARRLAAISTDSLAGDERVERPMVAAHIQARLLELEKIRSWERNPQLYGELLGVSLAGQALFDYAPAAERARRVLSKLRQVPRFIQSAQDNIKDPPGIFVKSGLEVLRGTLRFIEADLPRAFADVDDLGLLGDLADAQTRGDRGAQVVHGRGSRPRSARRRARRSGWAWTTSPPSCGSTTGSKSR